ncbi:MAG TPA: bifunctional phosphopantothenoylcysteine decarboxylase/phosphopantothenate--cysteine ligase CoaBC [Anaerolineae bacterium]|nr:bifunctional phosphopantothenoylcysteine decarboxylase/phosphopantothenate--cysteine ligase CoaBC [Anaerolineae bacterium]HCK67439.1 bifunctional phosphopantothenoylcysteine decarboxylase/phosphopantothenate--cysteine ligase CoaBC [Anaerolineae bacterium]
MPNLTNKQILLGVTGSIASYKAADLASKLTQAGAKVDVILTTAAQKFITPLTFQSVTGRKAYTDKDLWGDEGHVIHVNLAKGADLFVVAPCTANTIAKLAHGFSDDLLTVTALATTADILIAPAMDGGMFDNAATQQNLSTLLSRGVIVAGPATGHLASGMSGKGRMLEPMEILGHIRIALGKHGKLNNKKVIVTAGGTQEAIDPVRIITNHSSGKQGYALAQAAIDEGADVTLITTPTALTPPVGAKVLNVKSVGDMLDALMNASADALIMSAAAADFRPKHVAKDKIKKRDGIPQIELEVAPDILKTVSGSPVGAKRFKVVVGFAAESQDLLENASDKLKSKGLDFIAANDISLKDAGFAVETNRITLLFADGSKESLPLMSKTEAAEKIIEHVARLLE